MYNSPLLLHSVYVCVSFPPILPTNPDPTKARQDFLFWRTALEHFEFNSFSYRSFSNFSSSQLSQRCGQNDTTAGAGCGISRWYTWLKYTKESTSFYKAYKGYVGLSALHIHVSRSLILCVHNTGHVSFILGFRRNYTSGDFHIWQIKHLSDINYTLND